MVTKKSFKLATYHKGNCIVEWNGLRIRITLWKKDPWELVTAGSFETAEVISSFHTREDLWKHIKYDEPKRTRQVMDTLNDFFKKLK